MLDKLSLKFLLCCRQWQLSKLNTFVVLTKAQEDNIRKTWHEAFEYCKNSGKSLYIPQGDNKDIYNWMTENKLATLWMDVKLSKLVTSNSDITRKYIQGKSCIIFGLIYFSVCNVSK